MSNKQQYITEIRVGLSALGFTMDQILEGTKKYHRKTVAQLQKIWAETHKELREKKLIK